MTVYSPLFPPMQPPEPVKQTKDNLRAIYHFKWRTKMLKSVKIHQLGNCRRTTNMLKGNTASQSHIKRKKMYSIT